MAWDLRAELADLVPSYTFPKEEPPSNGHSHDVFIRRALAALLDDLDAVGWKCKFFTFPGKQTCRSSSDVRYIERGGKKTTKEGNDDDEGGDGEGDGGEDEEEELEPVDE